MGKITTTLKSDYNISIIPLTSSIGLTVAQNGSGEYHLYTTKDIDISSIDVKAILSGTTTEIVDQTMVMTTGWTEQNNYEFSVGEIKKKGKAGNDKYWHSVLIKLVNSPYIPFKSLSPLCLRLYVYYTLDGEDRRIVVDTENPDRLFNEKPVYITYNSSTYTERKYWPYSLQLDSIYRPFFFNAVLLFFEPNIFNSGYDDISSNTYGKFYFSIANGCTLRDGKVGSLPKYKIGDIKLDINFLNEDGTLDTSSAYNLTIKDNYRTFSEITDSWEGKEKTVFYDAHKRGIRECGEDNSIWQWDDKTTHGGIYLPPMNDKKYIYPIHATDYTNGQYYIPPSTTTYYDNFNKHVQVTNLYEAQHFDLYKPLNVSFSVSDASIDGMDYKTISVDCGDIRFPWTLSYKNGKVTIPYSQYNENVTYIYIQNADTNMLYNIFDILGKLNVDDYFSEYYRNDDIFNYLYYKHYGGGSGGSYDYTNHVRKIEFTYKEGFYEASVSDVSHILAIYHGGYEVADNNGLGEEDANKGDLLRYVNHTNKLLIMKLYKV